MRTLIKIENRHDNWTLVPYNVQVNELILDTKPPSTIFIIKVL